MVLTDFRVILPPTVLLAFNVGPAIVSALNHLSRLHQVPLRRCRFQQLWTVI